MRLGQAATACKWVHGRPKMRQDPTWKQTLPKLVQASAKNGFGPSGAIVRVSSHAPNVQDAEFMEIRREVQGLREALTGNRLSLPEFKLDRAGQTGTDHASRFAELGHRIDLHGRRLLLLTGAARRHWPFLCTLTPYHQVCLRQIEARR